MLLLSSFMILISGMNLIWPETHTSEMGNEVALAMKLRRAIEVKGICIRTAKNNHIVIISRDSKWVLLTLLRFIFA
jgi:hypothetical protein